jgi:hypothetical protein
MGSTVTTANSEEKNLGAAMSQWEQVMVINGFFIVSDA